MVPFLNMQARYGRTSEAVEAAMLAGMRSGYYIGGPVLKEAEQAIAALMGRKHGVGVANGTVAITQILEAMGIGAGDEVIVPAVTFFATAGAVLRAGATPVIVDVLPDRPLMDPDSVAAALSPRTAAVMPVHLFGDVCPHPVVSVPVIDDAAQAVGASPAAGKGIAAALSFYPTKILGVLGDGGMAVCDDEDLSHRIRRLGFHGQLGPHLHYRTGAAMGGNSRLDSLAAGVLLAQLPDLPVRIAERQTIAARYDAVVGDMVVPRDPGSPVSIYCIRHPNRDAFRDRLVAAGVSSAIYYPRSLSAQPALADCPRQPTVNAERFCNEAVALPCYEGMPEEDIAAVCSALSACL
ncbi:MAG: UDP-2-acetamido-2-deoxy-ribo-hexuluronate aminotransferase [Myxococcota bacterium]|jgi:UDP-2-acetamido-2-deoxy-ribo-hexuluronate aminotransferase